MQVGALDAVLKTLLPVTRVIDAVTTWIGKRLSWLILAAVVVSAVNATVRKIFDTSSNSWLELQWVLFSIVFLLCSPWTLLANEHIRIDIVNNLLPKRVRNTIDVVGHAFFLLPLTIIMIMTGDSLLPALHRDQRAVGECRRPAAMAGQGADHDRIRDAVHSGHFRTDQTHRRDARPHPGPACEPTKLARSRGRANRRAQSKNTSFPQADPGSRMEAFFIDNMAPIMFGALVFFLLLGYPAAFSLGAVGLIFALIGIELGLFVPDFLQALPERIYGVMSNDTLLAIPFFTFMGLVLERSGMAEDLLDTIGQLFGTVRGGLAYAVMFVGALLAATTGVVAASVISMGLISLPIMLRYGYDRRVASGVIAASGTLAQIIPPSLVLIVMADQLGRSVGDMYEGAFIPGIVLAGLYAGYVFLVTMLFPKATPGLPAEAVGFREADGSRGLISLGVLDGGQRRVRLADDAAIPKRTAPISSC